MEILLWVFLLNQKVGCSPFECSFRTSFEFPEQDIDLFAQYYHYAQIIKNILKNDWNYDVFLDSIANYKTYTLESKIDRILGILKSAQN